MGDDWLHDGDTWPDTDLVIDSTVEVQEAVNAWIVGGGLKDARHE